MPSQTDAIAAAIRGGDSSTLQRLIEAEPSLVKVRLGGRWKERTPLHVVTDWPGFWPEAPQIAQVLVDAGAAVDARSRSSDDGETPLHWTASSDDADVAAVLIAAGADLEAPHGSIGTPLDNAVGYSCWNVARLLVTSGARVDKLWHAAALGLSDRLRKLLDIPATQDEVSQAFWHACAAGQRRTAELLLERGADLNWQPDYTAGTPFDAAHQAGTQSTNLIEWLEVRGARSAVSS